MPIYEYVCKKCGEFETMQRITDPPLGKCPTCAGEVTKLISNTSFQLKGSGWYVTDYGRKDSGKAAGGDTKAETEKAETKSEASGSSDASPSTPKQSAAA